MSKLPCEVVRDLFPSYIDELTSEVTKELVEEHVAECMECHQVLSSMKNPEAEPVDEKNKKEIDFLKKTKKKNRKNLWLAVSAAVVLLLTVFFVRIYFIGTAVPNEYVACQVEVEDNLLTIKGAIAEEHLCISDVKIEETDGVVVISFESVRKSLFLDNSFEKTYTANQNITEVRLGDRILWAKGENISAVTSAVYQTKHPYIGDASANGRTAGALSMGVILGSYKNELQTREEPYGWKFLLEQELSISNLPFLESYMQSCAYVLLAVVENLGEVTYEYTYSGVPMVMNITEAEATAFAGQNIKSVGDDIVALQHLMEKAELTGRAYVIDYSQWNSEEKIRVEIVNLAEDDILEIALTAYYFDEEAAFTQTMSNADGSLVENGEVISFELLPEVFTDKRWKKEEDIIVGILVKNKDGVNYECVERVTLSPEFGYTYRYRLTGNKDEGYYISQ